MHFIGRKITKLVATPVVDSKKKDLPKRCRRVQETCLFLGVQALQSQKPTDKSSASTSLANGIIPKIHRNYRVCLGPGKLLLYEASKQYTIDNPRHHEPFQYNIFKAVGMLFKEISQKLFYTRKKEAEFIEAYNKNYAPSLRTDVAAFQFLTMKVAYASLYKGLRLSLAIKQDIFGKEEFSYASAYRIEDILIDHHHGLIAYLLLPEEDKKRVILFFRGTALGDIYYQCCSYFENIAANIWHYARRSRSSPALRRPSTPRMLPTGLRADFDTKGIGYKAFQNNEQALHHWLAYIQEKELAVTVAGFSLGGAFAIRLLASLSAEQLEKIQIKGLVFNVPGLDKATCEKLSSDVELVMTQNPYDRILWAGRNWPQKAQMIFAYREGPIGNLRSHTVPYLAAEEMTMDQEKSWVLEAFHSEKPLQPKAYFEPFRLLGGHLLNLGTIVLMSGFLLIHRLQEIMRR